MSEHLSPPRISRRSLPRGRAAPAPGRYRGTSQRPRPHRIIRDSPDKTNRTRAVAKSGRVTQQRWRVRAARPGREMPGGGALTGARPYLSPSSPDRRDGAPIPSGAEARCMRS
jgi:hypothetical protein